MATSTVSGSQLTIILRAVGGDGFQTSITPLTDFLGEFQPRLEGFAEKLVGRIYCSLTLNAFQIRGKRSWIQVAPRIANLMISPLTQV